MTISRSCYVGILAAFLCLALLGAEGLCATVPGDAERNSENKGEVEPDNGMSFLENKRILVLEKEVGRGAGTISTSDLVGNLSIDYSEGTFEKGTKIAAYYIDEKLPLRAYTKIGPVWYVAPSKKPGKRMKLTFDYEEEVSPDDRAVFDMWNMAQQVSGVPFIHLPLNDTAGSGTAIVVLVWWRGAWMLAGAPKVDEENQKVSVETDCWGYFVPVRTKVRDDIPMPKYTFYRGKKPDVEVVGILLYDSKVRSGDDVLVEKLDLMESYLGRVEFGILDGSRRTGIKIMEAKSIDGPKVLSFHGELTTLTDTIYATGYEVSKETGVIWAKEREGVLKFDGLPTAVLLTGIQDRKKGYLPTMRGNITFNTLRFDWKWQEMFHLKNFTYIATLTMPHGAPDERTILRLYLQFIIR